jgi:hypothetical protein
MKILKLIAVGILGFMFSVMFLVLALVMGVPGAHAEGYHNTYSRTPLADRLSDRQAQILEQGIRERASYAQQERIEELTDRIEDAEAWHKYELRLPTGVYGNELLREHSY